MQLAAAEETLAARRSELEVLLAQHKAVQLAKEQAKLQLTVVEQQVRSDRAARSAHLKQHAALVGCFPEPPP